MRLVYWILAGCFFTASFDLILNFNLAGQVRFAQILTGLIIIAALARTIQDGRILWPRGSTGLALWLFSQYIFLPVSIAYALSVQFVVVLSYTIVGVFAVVQLYGRRLDVERVMRAYVWSYIFVASFGLLQFTLPLFKLPSPLVEQWILHGRIARINGFNYEPSYYCTYLIMGWIMVTDLHRSGAHILGRRGRWIVWLVTAALVLSTSRTAWIIMSVEVLARSVPLLSKTLRSFFHQTRQGKFLIRLPRKNLILGSGVFVLLVVVGIRAILTLVNPIAFLQGTGIAGTASHSSAGRFGNAYRTFHGFAEHPFIGRSIGGVAPYLAELDGIEVHNLDEAHPYQGFPVPFELLVASGIFGIIPLGFCIYANTLGAYRTAKKFWPQEEARWLRALGRAMIFECLILFTDQSVLRVYVWFHLSMVMLIGYNLEFVRNAAPSAGPEPQPYPALEASPTA